jgi:hypothetical protein
LVLATIHCRDEPSEMVVWWLRHQDSKRLTRGFLIWLLGLSLRFQTVLNDVDESPRSCQVAWPLVIAQMPVSPVV